MIAVNSIGQSEPSVAATGSTVFVPIIPGAPTGLLNNPSGTTLSTASFTWSDSTTGGKVITDYKIQSDQASNIWITIAEGVTTKSYTATGLFSGLNYKFRVYARNSVGYSAASQSISILTAIVPGAPTAVTTSVEANNVRISW